ncbi:MAG TPA: TRAP transporter large permease subunit [Vicinamibacterales bacterium]|jgi:tripartite ATP-independent transporter DctM subunit|nr:TRAP transporter large permease subunit [Vicinamibacterales bacterium]
MKTFAIQVENRIASVALGGIMVLPLAEIVSRKVLGAAIPGSGPLASNLTLWLGLFGAAIAARDGKLLTLATGEFLPKGRIAGTAHVIAGAVGAMVATIFTMGGIALARSDRLAGGDIAAHIPTWVADLALPIGFGLIALRLVWHASPHWRGRTVALLGVVAGLLINQERALLEAHSVLPWLAIIVIAGILGAPIFALLGGIAVFASLVRGNPPGVLPLMAYQELTTSTGIAAIPLFTLAGFLLAEGKSSERLLRVFRAWVGWAPGGTAVAAATLCAFFTLFTGGSGVTILVLGGLLLPALVGSGYRERFSIGLLTASGSLGLLFPLSLPLMLYGIVSQKASIEDLFIGGLLPGVLMLGLLALLGVREGIVTRAERTPFQARAALAALWEAKWELMLPVVVVGLFVGGVATLVETAPIAALYTVIVQRYVHRDLPTWADVFRVAADCVALVGGVLLILAVAAGLTDYLVNAQIPTRLVEWTQAHVHSKLAFLLCLNVFLLLVGTLMDIFSAIVVVVPLILPLAEVYGIDYVHLGIIFVANLELGFLHPPLGLNLLLASVRFKKSVLEVTWATLPMLGILALGVLLITYVPWLTLGILHWMGR